MLALLVRLIAPVPLLFGLLIGLVQAAAADNRLAAGFGQDCAMPCFLGIHPGSTSLEAARAALDHHPWVRQIDSRMEMDYFGYEHLYFRWRPPGAAEDWDGEMITSYGTVYIVRLQAELTLVEVWSAFAYPPMVALSAAPSRTGQIRIYNTFLDDSSLGATLLLDCPLTYRGVLEGTVATLELRRRDLFPPRPAVARTPGRLLRTLRSHSRPLC